LLRTSDCARADQLAALLSPHAAVARVDPCRSGARAVYGPPTMAVLPSADIATE
jgi:hypothetical protein